MNRLLHYELVEQLGEGGMGVVYKARDTRLGRFVAVKVLAAGKASDPDRRLRFAREARAASALAHPNVLTVHEIGSEDGVDFIVTEYVPGKTLAELIPPRGLPAREALRWAVPIADALAATHAAGVIHRDLKPANVMVTDAGLVKILDFGLARFIDPGPMAEGDETEAVLTREGTVFGTCAYMSPEQAEGREVDARSDIFSLGAVLYEMVTGRKAFARDSASATIAAVLRDEPEPAGMVSPDLPPELERVIHRCLRKEPAKRFQSMADLKVALEELREESETSAPARARAAPPRRHAVIGIAAAVVLVAAVAGGWLARRPAPEAVEPTPPVPLTSFGGRILWPALSPDGNQVAFAWNGETQASFDLYVKLVGPGAPVRLTTDPGTESSPAWSPDGRQIAFLRQLPSGEWILAVIPALGGPERIVAEAPVFHQGITWSADGRALVVSRRATGDRVSVLCRVSIATGEVKPLARPPADLLGLGDFSPALSPDGRTLAFARARAVVSSSLHVLGVTEEVEPEGEPVPLTPARSASSQPAWTPDGKRIVYTEGGFGWSSNPSLMVIPASPSGEQKARRVLGGEGGEFPSLSRNGSLVFARPINDLNLWRLPLREGRPGRPEPLLSSTRMDGAPALSADGLRLAFTSDRGGSMQLWLASADGSRPVQLTSIVATNTAGGRWSPDGSRLVFTSNPDGNRDVFLTTPNGREPLRLTRSPSHNTSPSWSRDGAWVYFSSNREDGFQVWKMKPEPDAVAARVTRGGGHAARESADGRTLYFARQMGSGHGSGHWSVWKMPAGGGEETLLIPRIAQSWFFEVTARGIYYLNSELPGGELRFHRFSDGSDALLLRLDKRSGFGLAAASDDSAVIYTVFDVDATELMYVERFR
ncbi:MAG: PD40 domain-containing protein [Holophagales bacterium]|nr:PD40 domain-containing protein [Holophagales bacterium]